MHNKKYFDINELKSQADEKYEAGEMGEALNLYLEILSYSENNIEVIRNLISIYAQANEFEKIFQLCATNANEIRNDARCQYFLGLVHRKQNLNSEAVDFFENALLLGLEPNIGFVEIFEIYTADNNIDDANILLNKWREVVGDTVIVNLKQVELLGYSGNWNGVINTLRQILIEQPNHIEALVAMAKACIELQYFDDALATYDKGIKYYPTEPYFYTLKGKLYDLLDMRENAIQQFELAIASDKNFLWAVVEKASTLIKLNEYEQAIHILDDVLVVIPHYVEALFYKASALYELHKFNDAYEIYTKLEQMGQPLAIFYQGVIELINGDYHTGWAKYEYRKLIKRQSFIGTVDQLIPKWDGNQNLRNKSILVVCEQGLGDSIQFVRYLSVIKNAYNCHISLIGPSTLNRIFQDFDFIDQYFKNDERFKLEEKSIDFTCELLSLPYLCQNLISYPANIQNIVINSSLNSVWSKRLSDNSNQTKIGIVWFGNSRHENNLNRSIDLEVFFNALPPEFEYFILSNDVSANDQLIIDAKRLEGWSLSQFNEYQTDLYETAAYISQLDLVISVDTSLAHLSATLNIETWVLLSFTPDFRWKLDCDTSEWYPNMVLFRQESSKNDWKDTLSSVYKRLCERFE